MTPEQRTAWRAAAAAFRREVIEPLRPHEREWVEDHAARFPWEAIEEASRRGLRTLAVPARFGGAEVDIQTLCMVVEEVAAGDMGIAVALDQTWKISHLLAEQGTQEQQRALFEPLMADERFLLAIPISEPHLGSDKYVHAEGRLHTTATRTGDGWLLEGHKRYISNAPEASAFLVYAQTDPDAGLAAGVSIFLVHRDTPGLRIGRVHDKMSQRLANNAEIHFEGVRLPASALVGTAGEALARTRDVRRMSSYRGGNVEAGATALGTARAAYEEAVAFARDRVQGGRVIIEHQVIGDMLARMYTDLAAARALINEAARALDEGDPEGAVLGSMSKTFAADVAVRVCVSAVEIHGGAGIMLESPVQKQLRDAISFLHSDGPQQVHRIRIARHIAAQATGTA